MGRPGRLPGSGVAPLHSPSADCSVIRRLAYLLSPLAQYCTVIHACQRLRTSMPGILRYVDLAPINDLAKEFGISRETVYNLIRKHNLQTYKQVGDRRTYVNRDDLRPLLGPQPKRPASDQRR